MTVDQRDQDRAGDRWVLILIGGGIIFTVNLIIYAIWDTASKGQELPSMAEVVFGAIIGGALVKIADVLSALVTLATGRQSERLTDQLAISAPGHGPAPPDAKAAAEQVAGAAEEEAEAIRGSSSSRSPRAAPPAPSGAPPAPRPIR